MWNLRYYTLSHQWMWDNFNTCDRCNECFDFSWHLNHLKRIIGSFELIGDTIALIYQYSSMIKRFVSFIGIYRSDWFSYMNSRRREMKMRNIYLAPMHDGAHQYICNEFPFKSIHGLASQCSIKTHLSTVSEQEHECVLFSTYVKRIKTESH